MTTLRLRDGFSVRTLPDGDAVVSSESGAEAVIVNGSAAAVLDLLAGPTTEDAVVALFCESFPDQDAAQIRRDVGSIVQQLVQAGVVERS